MITSVVRTTVHLKKASTLKAFSKAVFESKSPRNYASTVLCMTLAACIIFAPLKAENFLAPPRLGNTLGEGWMSILSGAVIVILGAISLCAMTAMDWLKSSDPPRRSALPSAFFLLIAAIGLSLAQTVDLYSSIYAFSLLIAISAIGLGISRIAAIPRIALLFVIIGNSSPHLKRFLRVNSPT